MNKAKEIEIDLIDLMKFLIARWRLMLIVMLVAFIMLGGYKVVANIRYNQQVPVQDETVEVDLLDRYIKNSSLNEEQVEELKNAIALDEKLVAFVNTELVKYSDVSNSKKKSVTIQYSLKVETKELDAIEVGNMVMYSLRQYVTNGGMATQVCNDGYEDGEVEELVSMMKLDYSLPQKNGTTMEKIAIIPFYISCSAQNDDEALALSEKTKALVQKHVDKYKEHGMLTVSISNEYIAQVEDTSFQQKYSTKLNEYNTMNDLLTKKTTSFVDEQKAIFNLMTGKNRFTLADPTVTTRIMSSGEVTPIPVLSGVIKRGILGALIGLFLICGLYSCIYIFSGTIKTKTELEENYGIFVIGGMSDEKGMLATKIKSACEKNGKSKVGILSSSHDRVLQGCIQDLAEELRKVGIDCTVVEGSIEQRENFEQLLSLGELVAVEEQYTSKRSDLENLLVLCSKYGINLQGIIMKMK